MEIESDYFKDSQGKVQEEKTLLNQILDLADNKDSNYDFSAILEALEEIKKMNPQELASQVSQSHGLRLLTPRTEDEIHEFQKLKKMWDKILNQMSELAHEVGRLKENNQQTNEEKELEKKLWLMKQSLIDLDRIINKSCAVCRYFPLNDQDSLMLIYDTLEEKDKSLKGVFICDGRPFFLKPSSFPKELTIVSSSEHFTSLLKNAWIKMERNPKDLAKSTFFIVQGCLGGVVNIQQALQELGPLLPGIHMTLNLTDIIAAGLGNSDLAKFTKNLLGVASYGSVALQLSRGVPVAGPILAIAFGTGMIFGGARTIRGIEKLQEGLLVASGLQQLLNGTFGPGRERNPIEGAQNVERNP